MEKMSTTSMETEDLSDGVRTGTPGRIVPSNIVIDVDPLPISRLEEISIANVPRPMDPQVRSIVRDMVPNCVLTLTAPSGSNSIPDGMPYH